MNTFATISSERGSFVGGPVAGLKGAMNIGGLGSVFLVKYIVC